MTSPAAVGDVDVPTTEAIADRSRFHYLPALDGIRAVAVVGVLLYHASVAWIPGGFLGVDVFFALSGYLITTLLLLERRDTNRIDLVGFWSRRARRLLPALFAVTVFVIVYARFFADPVELSRLAGDALAALLYVANWRFIFTNQSYFEQFAAPSPLRHTWSLAIEEQWYLVWPIVVSLGYRAGRHASRNWAIGLVAVAGVSALWMAWLFHPDADPSRVFYGTDTRAQPLLLGAALAFALNERTLSRLTGYVLEGLGAAGLLAIALLFHFGNDQAAWMYRGGYLLVACVTCVVIAIVVQPSPSVAKTALAFGPLPLIGRLSYGLYLWHWPIYVLLTEERTGRSGFTLLFLRLAVTGVVATLSYNFIEMPIRHGAHRRLAARLLPAHPGRLTVGATVALMVFLGGSVLVTTRNAPVVAESVTAGAVPVAAAGDVKTLVVGDSVAFGLAYAPKGTMKGVAVFNGGIVGCGVFHSAPVPILPARAGQKVFDCSPRLDDWKADLAKFQPDMTILLPGSYEVFDQQDGDTHYAFGSAEYAKYVQDQLYLDFVTLTPGKKKMIFLTTPCQYETTEAGLGEPNPERRDPARTTWLNDQVRTFAKAHPAKTKVLDLAAYLCPTGTFQPTLDGKTLYRDGLHFTDDGAALVWEWLGPQLRAAMGK